uniref:F-box domain-containing protein n=2 Tax=Hordeum vulgare subsp. vulgare TaxID=112509 RepID=A0A8I6Y4W9_HORVV
MSPPPPPPLPDELLEEVFFRLPPDEPEHLLCASLVSKVWLALLSDPCFHARYRDFHGAPPMLGFLCSSRSISEDNDPYFFPTTKFRARIPDDDWEKFRYAAWDCRHGRVLLADDCFIPDSLVVWNPMTGCRRELDQPGHVGSIYAAVVLCAVAGCDHRACHAGPFQVAFIGTTYDDGECFARACVSMPMTMTTDRSKPCSHSGLDKWGEPCSPLHVGDYTPFWDEIAPVFLEDALYVNLMYQQDDHIEILKYDLGSNCLSLIHAPLAGSIRHNAAILMAMEDGSLGFAHVDQVTLQLWSRHGDSDGIGSWTQRTIIHLNNHLPLQIPNKRLRLIGSLEGGDTIFVNTGLDNYELNLKTLRWKTIQKREKLYVLIPYMSFYNPQEKVITGDVAH